MIKGNDGMSELSNLSQPVPSEKTLQWIRKIDEDIKYIIGRTDILAEMGWMISPDWTFPIIEKLLETENQEKVDDLLYFGYYTCDDNEELNELFALLQDDKSGLLSRWRPLINDCISSYRSGYYRVCLPSLISVIEGVLAMQCGNGDKTRNILKFLDDQIDKCKKDSVNKMIWISSRAFIDKLFSYHNFNDERMPLINRHWVEHGRDECNHWKEIDAIRLFNALRCIVWILGKYKI